MRLPFGRRTAELETKNRILTDAARKRAERIKELEHQLAQWEHQVAQLKTELESARKRASELEVLAAQRAHLLNEKDEELAGLREVLIQRAHLLNEKDEELAGLREVLTQRSLRIQELEKMARNDLRQQADKNGQNEIKHAPSVHAM
jgi:chromosome segregation ATPase